MFTEHVQRRRVQRSATRERVLTAAERLFQERGFSRTTIRQIAADAGVSTGTVMATGDKEALLVQIFDAWIAAVHDERGKSDAQSGALDPARAVREALSLFRPFVAYFSGDEDLAREYAAIIVRGRHDSAIFRGLGDTLTAEVGAVLGRAGVGRADAGARMIYLGYLGILMTASHGAIAEQEALLQLEEVIRFVIDPPEARS